MRNPYRRFKVTTFTIIWLILWIWKGGISSENARIRMSSETEVWRRRIFERDNYTCAWCGARNGNGRRITLHADHIKPFAYYPELRFVVSNGRTLCRECHVKTYSYPMKPTRIYVNTPKGQKLHGEVVEDVFCRRVRQKDIMRIFDAFSIHPDALSKIKEMGVKRLRYVLDDEPYSMTIEKVEEVGFEREFAGGKTIYLQLKYWETKSRKDDLLQQSLK